MKQKLRVTNYEAHVDTLLEFEPGVNAIVGGSENGKSSLLRAIRLVAMGVPTGSSYCRHGTKKTVVELDGVERRRIKSKNSYKIGEETYKALRSEVPPPVTERLKLKDVNFQTQHKPYFLIGESPGFIAKAMNEVADLGLIDHAQKEIKSRIRDVKNRIKSVEETRELKNSKREALEWAIGAKKLFSLMREQELLSGAVMRSIEGLKAVSDTVIEAKKKLDLLPSVINPDILNEFEASLSKTKEASLRLGASVLRLKELSGDLDGCPDFSEGVASLKEVDNRLTGSERTKADLGRVLVEAVSAKTLARSIPEGSQEDLGRIKDDLHLPSELDKKRLLEGKILTAMRLESKINDNPVDEMSQGLEEVVIPENSTDKVSGKLEHAKRTRADYHEAKAKADALEYQMAEEFGSLDICPLCESKLNEDN